MVDGEWFIIRLVSYIFPYTCYIHREISVNFIYVCVYKWLFNQYTTFKLSIHPISIPGGTYISVVIDPDVYMGCAHGHSEKTELHRYGGRLLEWMLGLRVNHKGPPNEGMSRCEIISSTAVAKITSRHCVHREASTKTVCL